MPTPRPRSSQDVSNFKLRLPRLDTSHRSALGGCAASLLETIRDSVNADEKDLELQSSNQDGVCPNLLSDSTTDENYKACRTSHTPLGTTATTTTTVSGSGGTGAGLRKIWQTYWR